MQAVSLRWRPFCVDLKEVICAEDRAGLEVSLRDWRRQRSAQVFFR